MQVPIVAMGKVVSSFSATDAKFQGQAICALYHLTPPSMRGQDLSENLKHVNHQ